MSLTDEQVQQGLRIRRKAEEAASFLMAVAGDAVMYQFDRPSDFELMRSNLCEARATINELLRELPESEF